MKKALRFLVVGQNRNEVGFLSRMLEIMGFEAEGSIEMPSSARYLHNGSYPDWIITLDKLDQVGRKAVWTFEREGHGLVRIPIVHLNDTPAGPGEDREKGEAASGQELYPMRTRLGSLLMSPPLVGNVSAAERIMFSLALDMDSKDPYTMGHSERISRHSAAIAKRMNLPEDQVREIRRGGMLHDIGKIAIPTGILQKPKSLTVEEINLVRQHPILGEKICRPVTSLHGAIPIIRHHHERMDGSGYPDGLKGEEIPLGARIVAAVDFFDALVTERTYSRAESFEEAIEITLQAADNGHLDRKVVEVLAEYVKEVGDSWVSI